MKDFKEYRRSKIAELREVNEDDIYSFLDVNGIIVHQTKDNAIMVSISDVDLENGSPKFGDMIARNPKNHLDQWLVAENYFKDNFEPIR